jgi:DNA helicase-2/ATP-dependent DNA helicase PcrA
MITSHPTSPDGLVATLGTYTPRTFQRPSPCAILCRNTAPLVAFAYGLLKQDIPCTILGRDIGAQLAAVVKKQRATSLEDLREKLGVWSAREAARAEAEGRSPERIADQYSCLMFFIRSLDEDSRSIASLLAKIDLMFTDTATARDRVVLSTVHKAKGLEYHTVFILDRSKYMPSRYAKLPWQQEQEKNLIYVAITRAQHTLYYITSDCWSDKETTAT